MKIRTAFFDLICRAATGYPRTVLAFFLAIAIISVILTFRSLRLETDQLKLISPKVDYHRKFLSFLSETGDQEYVFAVTEGADEPTYENFASRFAEELAASPELFLEFHYKVDTDIFIQKNLLFQSDQKVKEFAQRLTGVQKLVHSSSRQRPPSEAASLILTDPLILSAFLRGYGIQTESSNSDKNAGTLAKEGISLLDVNQSTHFFKQGSPQEPFYLFFILPKKDYTQLNIIEAPMKRLREIREKLKAEFPAITLGFTGWPVLQADEMETTNRDMTLATIIALIGILIIFVLAFRNPLHPLLAMAALLIGLAITYGFTTLTIGHLNILSIVFVLIIIGIGIDFGIHMVSRYKEERNHGVATREALRNALQTAGKGNLTGMFTSAAAFSTPLFSHFTGLSELGIIAAFGLFVAFISISFCFPALVTIIEGNRPWKPQTSLLGRAFLSNLDGFIRRPSLAGIVFVIAVLLVLPAIPFIKELRFSYNLLELQAEQLESVRLEKKIISESTVGSWNSGRLFDTAREERVFVKAARGLATVSHVETITDYLPEVSRAKRNDLLSIKQTLEEFPIAKFVAAAKRMLTLAQFKRQLEKLRKNPETKASLKQEIGIWLTQARTNPKTIREQFTRVKAEVFGALPLYFEKTKLGLKTIDLTLDELPAALTKRLLSKSSRSIVYLYPKENIWNETKMKWHLDELKTLDPSITGATTHVYSSAGLMVSTLKRSALLSLLFVFIIVFLDFRSIRYTALVFVPLLCGIAWLCIALALFDISFNLANFFCIPILIGIGIDNGIHLTHRFRESRKATTVFHQTGLSILITTLTTCVGFGAMMLASHRGVASLGKVMTIGMATCLVGSLIVLVALFRLLESYRRKRQVALPPEKREVA